MRVLHIQRGLHWFGQLLKTLINFWIKHPLETPAVIKFVTGKIPDFMVFLNRNTKTEERTQDFDEMLANAKSMYKETKKKFKTTNLKNYNNVADLLSNKSQLLYFIVRDFKPELVVETGVAAGESTGFILQAMEDNKKGCLYSIDLPFQWYIYGDHVLHLDSLPAGKLPGYLVPEKLRSRWKLIMGDTYKELPELLAKLKDVSMFIHDSEHTYKTMMFEYKLAWPKLKKGGLLISDDVEFTDAFVDFCKKMKTKYTISGVQGITSK